MVSRDVLSEQPGSTTVAFNVSRISVDKSFYGNNLTENYGRQRP